MYNYTLYRIGQLIALSLPLRIAYRIAILVSDLHYVFAHIDRQAVTENLRAIFPDKTSREIARLRIDMFRNFAKYLVDFFRFSKLDRQYIEKNIKIENIRYIDEALSEGKGAVILTAHLGNWELGGVVISLLKYPFWAVALSHKDKRVDNFFIAQRESKGIKVIPLGRAVRMSLNALKKNELVALVGDRNFSERGLAVDFFGKTSYLPAGPALLSLKTGAPIVPGFMVRNEDDTFTLTMEKPLRINQGGSKDGDLTVLLTEYKDIFEGYIRRYPDQWYMFKKFWA